MQPDPVRAGLSFCALVAGYVASASPASAQGITPVSVQPLGGGLPAATTHFVQDQSPALRDIVRVRKEQKPKKRNAKARRKTQAPEAQAMPLATEPANAQPRAEAAGLATDIPSSERKVRVIPLYRVPE